MSVEVLDAVEVLNRLQGATIKEKPGEQGILSGFGIESVRRGNAKDSGVLIR